MRARNRQRKIKIKTEKSGKHEKRMIRKKDNCFLFFHFFLFSLFSPFQHTTSWTTQGTAKGGCENFPLQQRLGHANFSACVNRNVSITLKCQKSKKFLTWKIHSMASFWLPLWLSKFMNFSTLTINLHPRTISSLRLRFSLVRSLLMDLNFIPF